MNIPKEHIRKIQADIDNEKKRMSNQLYLTLSNLLKKLHENDLSLLEQVSDLLDFHLSKHPFASIRDMVDYMDTYKETLIFLKPYYEIQDREATQNDFGFMYL